MELCYHFFNRCHKMKLRTKKFPGSDSLMAYFSVFSVLFGRDSIWSKTLLRLANFPLQTTSMRHEATGSCLARSFQPSEWVEKFVLLLWAPNPNRFRSKTCQPVSFTFGIWGCHEPFCAFFAFLTSASSKSSRSNSSCHPETNPSSWELDHLDTTMHYCILYQKY